MTVIAEKPKRRRRRRKKSAALDGALKDVRRMKLQFERDVSMILSNTLGFPVTVKIKHQLTTAKTPPVSKALQSALKRSSDAETAKAKARLVAGFGSPFRLDDPLD